MWRWLEHWSEWGKVLLQMPRERERERERQKVYWSSFTRESLIKWLITLIYIALSCETTYGVYYR